VVEEGFRVGRVEGKEGGVETFFLEGEEGAFGG